MGDTQIGRLQAALASATNDVTVAAANINFDFSLVKYEAPKEYFPIGNILSTKRKHDAENGKSHVTARRLAALFEGVCPETPNLIKAYGQRVSEISKAATEKEHGRSDFAKSMYSQYLGIDATSLWAAATSSNSAKGGALHVHLLACMLAKMWDAPEAVSIWDELIRNRRRVIADLLEKGDSIPFSLATAAAQQDILRAQLAEWDTSARAWLQTADSIMEKQQTQFRLILDNIKVSIDQGITVYSSVIEAWVKALTVLERLVSGIPQEVHDGAALLGLTAWHIYPDLHVFGSRNIEVKMKDELVLPGGVITLGCSPSATVGSTGVTWSLSLAHLRFYGEPVKTEKFMQSNPTLLTFDDMMQVTLGSILRIWRMPLDQVGILASIIGAMSKFMQCSPVKTHFSSAHMGYRNGPDIATTFDLLPGIQCLASAANAYLQNTAINAPLVSLGMNRPKWIPATLGHSDRSFASCFPLFGYLRDDFFLERMRNAEARIAFLRRIGNRFLDGNAGAERCIIRYRDTGDSFAWATVFAAKISGTRQTPRKGVLSHSRWSARSESDSPTELHYQRPYAVFTDRSPHPVRTGRGGYRMSYWYGNLSLAAIYLEYQPTRPLPSPPSISLEDLLWALENDLLDLKLPDDVVLATLRALARASKSVFCHLTGPIIRLRTFLDPLVKAEWFAGDDIGVQSTMSILSYFISDCNVRPRDIPENICGISFGNSMFVPAKFLCDPFEECSTTAVVRLLGNIGHPGFVVFSSVSNPMVSQPNEASFRVINANHFDGKPENAFASTSMHLSFTDWERSIAERGADGVQENQLFRMESVISIREAGRWVGDVDILRAVRDERISRLRPQSPCIHTADKPLDFPMMSVETWDQLRDCQCGNVVVRAHGNWIARLAIAAFLAQEVRKGNFQIDNIIVCPKKVCWKCTERYPACVYIY